MFDYLDDAAFVQFVLEQGKILFMVHGDLTCDQEFSFDGVRIFPPTIPLRVVGEHPQKETADETTHYVSIHDLVDEAVFRGELELPERSKRGVAMALAALEFWADCLCLANGNPRIRVEPQVPIDVVLGARRTISIRDAEKTLSYAWYLGEVVSASDRPKIATALWWYRKACNAGVHSLFDSYAAYWNALEILCSVSGSKIKQGEDVNQAVEQYFRSKKKIKAGHIIECFNKFVSYSIPQQMEDALVSSLGSPEGEQWAEYCFKIKPETNRLYQIRNDINHGNIQENIREDYLRVYFHNIALWELVLILLRRKLGHNIKLPYKDVHTLFEKVLRPLKRWQEQKSDL